MSCRPWSALFLGLVVTSGLASAGEAVGGDAGKSIGAAAGEEMPGQAPRPPAYLKAFSDESGDRHVVRVTGDAGDAIPGLGGVWSRVARQQYSKVGAWSCDQELMFLINREVTPSVVFLDGTKFEPLDISPPEGIREMRWHPLRPDTMLVAAGGEIRIWNVRTGRQDKLASFAGRVIGFGPWEGNLSDDGRHIVLTFGDDAVEQVVPFDLQQRRPLSPIRHGFKDVDWASISPSGRYVVVNGVLSSDQPDRTRVFTREGKAVGDTWSEFGRPSHFDLTLNEDGEDIAVGVSKSKPDEGSVISRRLKDGKVTRLTTAGFAGHTSTRNIQARGRALVSFAPAAPSWGPYSDQILSVSTSKLDDVAVVARMRARVDDYWSEPQPSASPDGRRVVFASNREQNSVAAYVADVPRWVPDLAHSVKACTGAGAAEAGEQKLGDAGDRKSRLGQ